MIYRCGRCGHRVYYGCLPTVSCGVYLIGLIALAGGILGALTQVVFPRGLGWWWLLGMPAILAASIAALYVLNFLLELIEWASLFCRRCPQCRVRRWSWGFTEGFGL